MRVGPVGADDVQAAAIDGHGLATVAAELAGGVAPDFAAVGARRHVLNCGSKTRSSQYLVSSALV